MAAAALENFTKTSPKQPKITQTLIPARRGARGLLLHLCDSEKTSAVGTLTSALQAEAASCINRVCRKRRCVSPADHERLPTLKTRARSSPATLQKRDWKVKKTQYFLGRSALSTGVLGVAIATAAPAFAQVAADAAAADETDMIIVTGSRIARPDLEANSPLAVVGQQEIQQQAASANIENVLNDLPQITATTSSTSNNPGGGVATVNLRNLGSQRTLVLVDGRRYMSYDVTQVVDLNTIPAALIERVDVVTGGQSAVYGSDAIAGAVNFVLKRDFSGVELNSSYNLTERGDGQIWDINGTIGTNFDDGRGNVTLHAGYTKRRPTFAGERKFSRDAASDNQDGSPLEFGGGSGSVPEGRINIPQAEDGNGNIITPGLNTLLGNCDEGPFQIFRPDGSTKCYTSADGYNFNPINYLQVPQERFLVSAMAEYEINEHFRPYMEAQFTNNRVVNQLAATPISNGTPFGDGTAGPLTLQTASPFLAPNVQAALAAIDAQEMTCDADGLNCAPAATAGDGYVTVPGWNYRTTQLGPRANTDERNAFRVVAGMKGEIGGGFSYDGYYMYARTKNSQRQSGNIAVDRFLAATNTAFDASGNLVCAGGQTGCVPANIFGLGNLSSEAINYLGIGATNLETYTTQVASLAITNPSLFDLGAGGVGIAFGVEYRSENGSVEPDQFLASGNVAGFNAGQPTSGGYHLTEFFGEINVPLVRDSFIHLLELNGAARYSKYSNAPGNVFTWAAGATLAPVEDISFRGQYQKAVRGPSVSELFLGNTVSFAGNADQCGTSAALTGQLNAICVAQFRAAGAPLSQIGNASIQGTDVNPLTFVGGNPNLQEETAKTWTVGTIVRPTFVRNFALTVDYYNIKISNLIGTVGTDNIGGACFDNNIQEFCDLIQRNALGQIDTFTDINRNTGGLKTSGIDVGANYSVPLGPLFGAEEARLSFKLDGSYLLTFKVSPVAGLSELDYTCDGKFGASCLVPTPKWKHSFRTTLAFGALSGSVQWRYIGKARDDDPDTLYAVERMSAQNYIDLTASADVTDNVSMNIGVSNLFDKKPPLSASGQNGGNGEQSNTFPTLYDVLGRSFFVSARLRF